jgi:hypothetical protein
VLIEKMKLEIINKNTLQASYNDMSLNVIFGKFRDIYIRGQLFESKLHQIKTPAKSPTTFYHVEMEPTFPKDQNSKLSTEFIDHLILLNDNVVDSQSRNCAYIYLKQVHLKDFSLYQARFKSSSEELAVYHYTLVEKAIEMFDNIIDPYVEENDDSPSKQMMLDEWQENANFLLFGTPLCLLFTIDTKTRRTFEIISYVYESMVRYFENKNPVSGRFQLLSWKEIKKYDNELDDINVSDIITHVKEKSSEYISFARFVISICMSAYITGFKSATVKKYIITIVNDVFLAEGGKAVEMTPSNQLPRILSVLSMNTLLFTITKQLQEIITKGPYKSNKTFEDVPFLQ